MKPYIISATIVAITSLLSACMVVDPKSVPLSKAMISSHTGCPPQSIIFSNQQYDITTEALTFTAQCQRKTFYCSITSGSENSPPATTCKQKS